MLEEFFARFRENIVGVNHRLQGPYGVPARWYYADWTASGRLYGPIERRLSESSVRWWATPTPSRAPPGWR